MISCGPGWIPPNHSISHRTLQSYDISRYISNDWYHLTETVSFLKVVKRGWSNMTATALTTPLTFTPLLALSHSTLICCVWFDSLFFQIVLAWATQNPTVVCLLIDHYSADISLYPWFYWSCRVVLCCCSRVSRQVGNFQNHFFSPKPRDHHHEAIKTPIIHSRFKNVEPDQSTYINTKHHWFHLR